MPTMRKLRWPVALLASLLCPGLGQLYNGQPRKAGLLLALLLASIGASSVFLFSTFSGLRVALGAMGLLVLGAVVDAATVAHRLRHGPRRSYNRWYLYVFMLLVVDIGGQLFIRGVMPYKTYRTSSGSMKPTLEPGDQFMVERIRKGDARPRRGDLIVFSNPLNPVNDYVQRVVGLPGDKIEYRDKVLYVDGVPVSEPHVIHLDHNTLPQRDTFGPLGVPSGAFFVLGDNRDQTRDSRFFGCVPRELIKGRLLYIYLSRSLDRIGRKL